MKILVCISKTPDTTAKISFTADGSQFNEDGVQFIMNPYDEWYALVKALEIKEQVGGTVTVINVGTNANDTVIRKALAIGADDAIRVNMPAATSRNVAQQIADVANNKGYELILLGKETINYNGSEVGSMISGLLDWPFISYATALELNGDDIQVTRDIEGGGETISVSAPLIVSAAKGLAEQRIPNMRGIMMAKRKPLEVIEPVGQSSGPEVVKYQKPAGRTACTYVDAEQMDELVRLLHEEAKVI